MSGEFVTRGEFVAWRNRAAVLYLLLGALCTVLLVRFQQEPQQRVEDLSDAAAQVVFVRCERLNAVAGVLRSSLRAQLALTAALRESGQITQAQYAFSVAALNRSIDKLDPEDCVERSQQIRAYIR